MSKKLNLNMIEGKYKNGHKKDIFYSAFSTAGYIFRTIWTFYTNLMCLPSYKTTIAGTLYTACRVYDEV